MRRPDEYATKPSRHYASDSHFVVEQRDEGGFRNPRSVTTMAVRRVVPSGGSEELQIEITIDKIGEKRTNQSFGHLTLTPEMADQLAAACAKIRERP
jgi:hypothetical protein